jgi:hypothetical protein
VKLGKLFMHHHSDSFTVAMVAIYIPQIDDISLIKVFLTLLSFSFEVLNLTCRDQHHHETYRKRRR